MPNPQEFYQTNITLLSAQSEALGKLITSISAARFAAAVAIAFSGYASIYGSWNLGFVVWVACTSASILAFMALVTFHAKLFKQKEGIDALWKVNSEELRAVEGDLAHIPHGAEFLSEERFSRSRDYALDLDIFGEASLFQRVNRTVTPLGAERLAQHLVTPLSSAEDIRHRHPVIAELSRRTAFRQSWQAAQGRKALSSEEMNALYKWIGEKAYISERKWLQAVMFVLPVTVILCLVWVFFQLQASTIFEIFWLIYFVQFGVNGLFLRRIFREASIMQRTAPLLSVYVRLFKAMRLANAEETFTTSVPKRMVAYSEEAMTAIRTLANLLRYLEFGNSLMGALLLNGTLLWNLHCTLKMEKWRARYGSSISEWLDALGETDALVSLAGYAFNNPNFVTPTILESEQAESQQSSALQPSVMQPSVLLAKGLAHPFLPANTSIRNDISFDDASGRIVVITGANMAGKSTFLRALGLNTVLAMIGLPVCAEEFECSVVKVMTSMRTTDSLERHESYFFAELQRLQMIVQHLKQPDSAPTLVLLDEILRGTNSADKKSGTIGLLRHFIQANTPTVVATHDTDVGVLEQEYPATVRNYCFEGIITDGELSFDYTLRRGAAQNKNATFLMQKMGII
jgi:hypothetical protein